MKNLCIKGVFFLALFAFITLPPSNCFAAEVEGVEGITYLTFLTRSPYMDLFSFEDNGNIFKMELLEKELEGAGTYEDLGVIFTAEWTSTDETDESTTYNFTGLSFVSLVIMGTGERTVTSEGEEDDTDKVRFFGIMSGLIPD